MPACPRAPYICGKGGIFTGNRYLIPLTGGSGGEGALYAGSWGGGAGGGAILLASSTLITVNGAINAFGGDGSGNIAGAGSGGAIRLVAPTLSGARLASTLRQRPEKPGGRLDADHSGRLQSAT